MYVYPFFYNEQYKEEIEIVGKIGSLNHPYFFFAQNLTEMDEMSTELGCTSLF